MKSTLRFAPLRTVIMLLLISTIGLFSCGKDADPSVIKVSQTAISGLTPTATVPTTGTGSGTTTGNGTGTGTGTTINANGDGGVAIGNAGTIVFTLKGKTYTLVNTGNTYLVSIATLTIFNTTISQVVGAGSVPTSDVQFSLAAQTATAGVYDASGCVITLADGTSYSLQTKPVGKINFNTYTNGIFAVTSKGTFDVILGNDKNAADVQRVSGSFNVQ